jgi:hypothetical protein
VGGLVLAFDFSLSPGLGEFLITGGKDGLFFAKKLVVGGDVSDGGVEAHGVVTVGKNRVDGSCLAKIRHLSFMGVPKQLLLAMLTS